MDYSKKSLTDRANGVRESLAGTRVQGIAYAARGDLSDWVGSMEAVKALCPVWPIATNESVGIYRL